MKPLLLLLLLLAAPGRLLAQDAAAPDLIVRSSVTPESGGVVGQHIRLYVDVLFRGDMPRPPRVAIPEVPGVQIFRFETQATTIDDRIGGQSYVGQRFEFALYPRRGGDFTIPPPEIGLLNRDGGEAGSARGEPTHITVSVPPGVDPTSPVLATNSLTLDEQWTPAPTGPFKAGDAILRTVTRSAEDVPAFAMQDLPLTAPEGVRAYAASPESEDRMNRGAVTGVRVDRITYLFERGGRFELPDVAQPWWDLEAGSLKTEEGVGATVSVAEAPVVQDHSSWMSDPAFWRKPSTWMAMFLLLAGLGVLGSFARRMAGRARDALWRRRAAYAASERKAFEDLRQAGSTADANRVYHAFAIWRGRLPSEAQRLALNAAGPLETVLFGPPGATWTAADNQDLIDRLSLLRGGDRHAPSGRRSALPPLNPVQGYSYTDAEQRRVSG